MVPSKQTCLINVNLREFGQKHFVLTPVTILIGGELSFKKPLLENILNLVDGADFWIDSSVDNPKFMNHEINRTIILEKPEDCNHVEDAKRLIHNLLCNMHMKNNAYVISTESKVLVRFMGNEIRCGRVQTKHVSVIYFEDHENRFVPRTILFDNDGNLADAPQSYYALKEIECKALYDIKRNHPMHVVDTLIRQENTCGDSYIQNLLGDIKQYGHWGCNTDEDEALAWYEKSSAQGCLAARYNILDMKRGRD